MKEVTDDLRSDDETVGRVIHATGPRPPLPDDLREAARETWRAKLEARAGTPRPYRRWSPWALAAALLLVAGVSAFLGYRFGPARVGAPPVIATVEGLFGPPGGTLKTGDALSAGAAVETGPGERVALRLAGGEAVRLDVATRLELESAAVLALRRGAVYLDSGGGSQDLAVKTRFGVARDVGTQFEVRLLDGAWSVQVREGEVRLELGDETVAAPAGTTVTARSDGTLERAAVSAHGAPWDWVLRASPPFELEGRSVREFLAWVTRETGWRLRFADPELERETREIIAHGSIAGLTAAEAPEVVLPSSGLDYRTTGGTLVIARAGGSGN